METEERLYQEINTVFLKRRLKRTGRMVLLLAALSALFFGAIDAYARLHPNKERRIKWTK